MKTAFVVEDSATDRDLATRTLQQAGFSVTALTSAEEAEAKIAQQKPDLVILDVILPGQSGFELCRTLKTAPETSGIPIIICSTKETDVDKMWGTMLGADAYLAKPIDADDLTHAIAQVLR